MSASPSRLLLILMGFLASAHPTFTFFKAHKTLQLRAALIQKRITDQQLPVDFLTMLHILGI
jgi:hypothetical protein